MSNISDFKIKDGVLKKYVGNGGDVVVPEDVIEISARAFQDDETIVSIVIPDSVTKIGNYAFSGCSSLTNITLPKSLTQISDYLFLFCVSLTNVVIPDGVTKIGSMAFTSCLSLASVEIPESVKNIGDFAFSNCRVLGNITITKNVTKIGNWAFERCDALETINIRSSIKTIGRQAFKHCDRLKYICAPMLSIEPIKANSLMLPAAMGFLNNHELFTDEEIIAEYKKYVSSQKKKLLPDIFKDDNLKAISCCAENGIITKKNFETDFLNPALEANATQCVAYLLNWKNENI